ncbi:hypothetical protein B4N84_16315 [Flavobacterium sp. IR1]|nr:hypothetical protein B4N84_16315 [Flavobacterium sp. IR1]
MRKIMLFTVCLLIFSCKKEDKEIVNIQKKDSLNVNLTEIRRLIKLQKNANYIDYRPENPYLPTKKDLLAVIPFVEHDLKNKGFKTIPDAEFEKKVNFLVKNTKIKLKNYDGFTTIFTNGYVKKNEILDASEFEFDTENQFAIKNYNFIIPMLFLEDVIKIKEDNSYTVAIPDYIIARNRYFFNDSKADLDWLLDNDKDFLKKLVISLGYDSEPKINKLVLEEYYEAFSHSRPSANEKLGTFLFTKDLKNNFLVRQGLVNYIRDNTTVNDNRFIYALGDYAYDLYSENLDIIYAEDPFKTFSDIEKAHIVSIIASIEVPATEKYKPENPELWTVAGPSLYNLLVAHPEIKDIIIKNNYFGIENMKQVLEDTVDEIYINDFKRNNKNDDDE